MKEFFENKCLLGKVERVDYVSKSDNIVSVFVHFEYWFENSRHFIQMMSHEKSEYKLTGYFTSNGHFHEIVSKNNIRTSRYISVKINKTPIPSVQVPELNIHQLVASNKFMENLIEEQKVKMEKMQAEIEMLKAIINNTGKNKKIVEEGEIDDLCVKMSNLTIAEPKRNNLNPFMCETGIFK
jgi:hypothetical protein